MMLVPKLRHEQRTEVPETAAAATVGRMDAATSSWKGAKSRNERAVAATCEKVLRRNMYIDLSRNQVRSLHLWNIRPLLVRHNRHVWQEYGDCRVQATRESTAPLEEMRLVSAPLCVGIDKDVNSRLNMSISNMVPAPTVRTEMASQILDGIPGLRRNRHRTRTEMKGCRSNVQISRANSASWSCVRDTRPYSAVVTRICGVEFHRNVGEQRERIARARYPESAG